MVDHLDTAVQTFQQSKLIWERGMGRRINKKKKKKMVKIMKKLHVVESEEKQNIFIKKYSAIIRDSKNGPFKIKQKMGK